MASVHRAIFKALVISFLCGIPCNSQQTGCRITIPTDLVQPEPIYLVYNDGSPQLFDPQDPDTYLAHGSKLTISCPGYSERDDRGRKITPIKINIVGRTTDRVDLTCGDDNQFIEHFSSPKQGHRKVSLSEIVCTHSVSPSVVESSVACANNKGFVFNIGFQISNKFFKIFEVCYDKLTYTTRYAKHSIKKLAQDYKAGCKPRPFFEEYGTPDTIKMENLYKLVNQKAIFDERFGDSQSYVTSTERDKQYLGKGHLAPTCDFLFNSFRRATFLFVNVAPQFQATNGGNWEKVENLVTKLSKQANSDFLVYTGTYGILMLPKADQSTTLQEVFLTEDPKRENKMYAPKWFWKVVKNGDSAIVFVTSNNPYARNAQEVGIFCQNVLDPSVSFTPSSFGDGFTFACTLDHFKREVDYLPSDVSASKLLDIKLK